ncbi:MAG: GumC family protein [Roseinatronobacter sp.]
MSEIKFYFSLVLQRLHWIILVGVIGTVAATWYARSLPATYSARVVMIAESPQIPGDLAASTVRTDTGEQLQILRQRVMTRDVLIDLANRLNVYAAEIAAGAPRRSGDQIVEDMRARLSITVSAPNRRTAGGATLVTVMFRAPSAQLAADVANEMATRLLRENVEMRTAAARQTLEFFEQEVTRLDQELARRSAAILEFQQQNLNALPAAADFTRNRLTGLQDRLDRLDERIIDLSDRRAQAMRMREIALADTGGPAATAEARELRDLQTERSRVITLLSPQNPRVRVLDAQIERLETIVAEQAAAASQAGQDGVEAPQQMTQHDVQIADLDRQIAALERERPRLEESISRLQEIVDEIPANTVILETLERDYNAAQARYSQAVANRSRAETGDTIESMARGQRLNMVEPATAPRAPDSPNRMLIMLAGGAGSTLLGFALALGLTILRPVIRRPEDLTRGLGITPFATLPYMRTEAEIFRRRLMLWGGGATAVIVLGVGVWVLDSQVMPLDMIVERMRARFG